MNNLKKMKQSCIDFQNDLKTGNLEWRIEDNSKWEYHFKIETPFGDLKLMLCQREKTHDFECRFVDVDVQLKSTTAHEAAHEALQLVKAEAQKLVDMLSQEPKKEQPFWTPIDPDNLPRHEVFAACLDPNDEDFGSKIAAKNFTKTH